MLRQGEGLPNCEVKLVRMVGAQTLVGMLKVFKDGAEFNTVTDEKGKYRFENVPVAEGSISPEST